MSHISADEWLKALKEAGAQKAQVFVTETERLGLAVENKRIFLSRSSIDRNVEFGAIVDGGYASSAFNGAAGQSSLAIARQVVDSARTTAPDPARDISPFQDGEDYDNGIVRPDKDLLHYRLTEFLSECGRYPKVTLRRMTHLEFITEKKTFVNSNGVRLSSRIGYYELFLIFSAREGDRNSLGYFTVLNSRDLENPLMGWGMVEALLKQAEESVDARSVSGKFTGDIVLAPECLGTFLEFLLEGSLRDAALISGTSVYKDKLGERIAPSGFSLSSSPLSKEIAGGCFITPDGYRAADMPIIEGGRLKNFLLSQYGARKTGLGRASGSGGFYTLAPGADAKDDLIKSVKRGLLVTRLSCGQPSQNGDFSGVAKNSFYIEDGRIKFPVSETMISGNLYKALAGVSGISRERVSLGTAVYPWVAISGINISGK